MTARFLAVYETPADPGTFDRHYRNIHIPLARRLPELRRYVVSRDVAAVRGDPYYLVAELEWDTMEELLAAFASEAGRATAADAANLQQLATVRSITYTADDVTAEVSDQSRLRAAMPLAVSERCRVRPAYSSSSAPNWANGMDPNC